MSPDVDPVLYGLDLHIKYTVEVVPLCMYIYMTKWYGYDRMTMVQCLIKGYIESTKSRIVIVIYKHIVMYINIYKI